MKGILRKNQVIIAALAIMIIVAGYLNLTGTAADREAEQTGGGIKEDYSEMLDISDEDGTIQVGDSGELITTENGTNQNTGTPSKAPTGSADNADGDQADNGDGAAAPTPTQSASAEADGENSEQTSGDRPGEAILVSTEPSTGYFSSVHLNREQTRARNRETLMSIINDASLSDDLKQDAVDALVKMTDIAAKENATEALLEAQGYEGVIVQIIDDSVDVIVNAATITEQEIAQIEDVVIRKTEIPVENIVISPVITEE